MGRRCGAVYPNFFLDLAQLGKNPSDRIYLLSPSKKYNLYAKYTSLINKYLFLSLLKSYRIEFTSENPFKYDVFFCFVSDMLRNGKVPEGRTQASELQETTDRVGHPLAPVHAGAVESRNSRSAGPRGDGKDVRQRFAEFDGLEPVAGLLGERSALLRRLSQKRTHRRRRNGGRSQSIIILCTFKLLYDRLVVAFLLAKYRLHINYGNLETVNEFSRPSIWNMFNKLLVITLRRLSFSLLFIYFLIFYWCRTSSVIRTRVTIDKS